MRRIVSLAFLGVVTSLAGCGDKEKPKQGGNGAAAPMAEHPAAPEPKPQLFEGIGSFHRAVATSSKEAQRWFDQGLTLLYAFNHDEAILSFREAARLDPACAMAWWGVALANGPHINRPDLPAERATAAFQAIQKAKAAGGAAPLDKELIAALSARYSSDPKAERAPLDKAYADAMGALFDKHPDDPDVGTLYAESMMDLRPWDLWKHDGTAQPGTERILAVLEGVLARAPDHPGANHFYVHSTEASPNPEKGVPSAERLRTLVPMSGHLVHMPAHTFQRVGRYEDAAEANRKAIAAEEAYLAKSPQQDFYMVYVLHNEQFLAYSATMEGRSEEAIAAARRMVATLPPEVAEAMPDMIDGAIALPVFVLAKFGRWDEILKEPEPSAKLPLTRGSRHFARGLAFAAQGKFGEASREMTELAKASGQVGENAKFGLNNGRAVLSIAHKVLAAEIAQRTGQTEQARKNLEAAVEGEDALNYDEPPDWFEPVRHRLGQLLLDFVNPALAEPVFREDLRRNPENGWSLFGLAKSLAAQHKDDEAADATKRFEKAWSHADVKLVGARY